MDAVDALGKEQGSDLTVRAAATAKARDEFALELKNKLPPYIVEAIEHVTAPIDDAKQEEEPVDGVPA